jgi:hypothetical protein
MQEALQNDQRRAFDGTSNMQHQRNYCRNLNNSTLAANVLTSSLLQLSGSLTVTAPISGSVTGNAGTATALATPRTINGVAFDGTSNINITATADAGTLTGSTLAANVLSSSLTSVGTLGSLTVTAPISGSITGNAATATSATTAGTVTTAAQPAITSVGTLSGLTVTAPISGSVRVMQATATALATPRTINGVAFDGTSNINITAPPYRRCRNLNRQHACSQRTFFVLNFGRNAYKSDRYGSNLRKCDR